MQIGFDAKRIFFNATGLGNYGRTLLEGMAGRYPGEGYLLFTPRMSTLVPQPAWPGTTTIIPASFAGRALPALWRSGMLAREAMKRKVDLYHGLSSELPFGIHRTKLPTVVTVHDLIFERYPAHYNPLDVRIYRFKTRYACRHAGHIIAVSEQTKSDLMRFYDIRPEKISVIYQGSDPVFGLPVPRKEKEAIRTLYGLPEDFFLYVGAVVERKNLLVAAQALIDSPDLPPLAVVGAGRQYKARIKHLLSAHHMEHRIFWLSERGTVTRPVLAALYRMACALLYPSLFEGYGIPIQEAFLSGTPVITSHGSCLTETGGDAALYIDPKDAKALAEAMEAVWGSPVLAEALRRKGFAQAARHSARQSAAETMQLYRRLCGLAVFPEKKKPAQGRFLWNTM